MRFLFEDNYRDTITYLQRNLDAAKGMKAKEKVIKRFISNLRNYEYLKDSEEVLLDSIYYSGFDPKENPYLRYAMNLNNKVTESTARLVKSLILNDHIDPYNADYDWLYKKDLYDDSENNIQTKIKCLTWVTNKELQRNASRQIQIDELFNNGVMMQADDMQKVLSQITVRKDKYLSFNDFFNYMLAGSNKPVTVDTVKSLLTSTVMDSKNDVADFCKENGYDLDLVVDKLENASPTYLKQLGNTSLKLIKSKQEFKDRIAMTKDIIRGMYNVSSMPNLHSKEDRQLDKEQKVRVDKETKEKEKIEKDGNTGATILATHLGTDKLTVEQVRDYAKSILTDSGNMRVINAGMIDSGAVDDSFEKILKSRHKSNMGREPLELLDTAMLAAIEKVRKNTLRGK